MMARRAFTIYLTDEDKECLDKLAKCANLSRTEYVRKLILKAYKEREKIDKNEQK